MQVGCSTPSSEMREAVGKVTFSEKQCGFSVANMHAPYLTVASRGPQTQLTWLCTHQQGDLGHFLQFLHLLNGLISPRILLCS